VAGAGHAGSGRGTAWADYNGDGDLDLYVTNAGGANVLYQNDGGGAFTNVTSMAGVGNVGDSFGTAWADYDGDGDLDLYVTNDGANVMYRNDGSGAFTDMTGEAGVGNTGDGHGTAWADYDGDGDLDLYVANYGVANVLYQNDGDGIFTDMTSEAGVGDAGNGYGTAWADYDGDGDLDLYVANAAPGANVLYQNHGNGAFTDVASEASVGDTGDSRGAAWADYDGDGDLDLYVTNHGANVLYRNNGEGTFTDMTNEAGVGNAGDGIGTSWADYDGDGDLDLYVANYGATDMLYQNDGDGIFIDVASVVGVEDMAYGVGTAWADYDGDGDLDLYVANNGTANVLYQNDGDVTSITLVVKPLTDAGAPSVFGAVTLSTADGNMVALRTLDGGSGYCSQNRWVLSGKR
jgi:hypothetical protein